MTINIAKTGGYAGYPTSRWSCPCACHYKLKQACNMCGCAKVLMAQVYKK